MIAGRPLIELRRLYRFFGNTCAVNDVSFDVNAGEVFGYIGPNGAGKTTSMRIIATLDLPNMGDALVDGFSVINDPDRVRAKLGFMPDSFGTYSHVNCEEYLDFFARAYGLVGKDRISALKKVMSFTQLDRLAQKPINGLSKGMKQRLCLGRALINDPQVLILDEPAAGLDPRARIELRDMIGELAAQDKAILISSHILTELAEMCDRVGIIEQGRLLAMGSVKEILAQRRRTLQQAGHEGEEVTKILVTVLGDVAPVARWLDEQDKVSDLEGEDQFIQFQFPDDLGLQAELLKQMIGQGFTIAGFTARHKTLEEAFLEVTRGEVQ